MRNRILQFFSMLFCLIAAFAVSSFASQSRLAEKMVRLHIIAASNSDEDQSVKLALRDEIAKTLGLTVSSAQNAQDAIDLLKADADEIASQATAFVRSLGTDDRVTAELGQVWFPSRDYGDFSLPEGEYTALTLTIGEGAGHNWWCVLYPGLCYSSVEKLSDTSETAGLNENEIDLISADRGGIRIKFKIIELFERAYRKIAGKPAYSH